jgi:hypothetical protein
VETQSDENGGSFVVVQPNSSGGAVSPKEEFFVGFYENSANGSG